MSGITFSHNRGSKFLRTGFENFQYPIKIWKMLLLLVNYGLPGVKHSNEAFANAAVLFLHHCNLLLVIKKIALDFPALLILFA